MRGILLPLLLASFTASAATMEHGRELFTRTWTPWDERAASGGDGLGPMYNATSCAACHNQGAVGGAGGKERNVRLVKASGAEAFVVDHRASTLTPRALSPQSGTRVERNTPALFGGGLIDQIPDEWLSAIAQAQPEGLSGRVARTADGRVGRFGWKGHTASLSDFVKTACANELGLAVEGTPQGRPPAGELFERLSLMQNALAQNGRKFDLVEGPRRDLSNGDIAALTDFVRGLPAPGELHGQPGQKEGKLLLATAGCTGCHVEQIGPVKGIYSDLLLHDVGSHLSDAAGSYDTRGNERSLVTAVTEALAPATATEWRTPPLWGVRDSGPYLHDGRAATLDDAIRAHAGEAAPSVTAYLALGIPEQQLVLGYLESLVAPTDG